jgi:hypothetical protein
MGREGRDGSRRCRVVVVEHHCRRNGFSWLVDNLLFCVIKAAVLGWRSMYTLLSFLWLGRRC